MGFLGKVSSPDSAGAYSNYYKAEEDAQDNPRGYANASHAVTTALDDLGLPQSWLKPTLELVARESSFNPDAANANSSARGLFQFMDGTRNSYGGDGVDWQQPYNQAVAGLQYIKDRYGDPVKALQYWDRHKSY